ncbi:unnamed protein product [Tilletia laevis]|uniref:Integrase catalytic domain-containing protein n=1 Tax=Tilletia laevis TaxID=157183 RepID=A0A9N8LGQ6_9BASI|nr:unnamed protein product [Tilletia caries]CAD6915133.1 unnamed protein product [Tilletia laevis]
MTPNASGFSSLRPDSTVVITASGKRLRAAGRGTVTLQSATNPSTKLVLYDVLHVPALEFQLISVFKLNWDYLRVGFTEELAAVITDPFDRSFAIAAPWSSESQAYLFPTAGGTEFSALTTTATGEERNGASDDEELALPHVHGLPEWVKTLWILWHERLGHLGRSSVPTLAKNSVGLPEQLVKLIRRLVASCEVCSLTNIRKSPFPTSTTKTSRALELVHADLTGRIIVKSFGGAEYLAILVDDFTRMVWVLPLAKKSDFVAAFIKWRDEVVPFKGPIACLRTDGGGEFVNAALNAALSGARHEMSCAYTSQQNGVAERHVGLIKHTMRPLLHARHLPVQYWAAAASTAAYIRNRSPSSVLDGITPFEAWHGTPPNLADLRVFGCLAFAMLPVKTREHSLAVRARAGVFVGYDKERKGYRVHFPDTGEITITKHVEFHEDKGYDFTTIPRPEPDVHYPQEVTEQAAPQAPGLRPRIRVIGPRPPQPVPSITTIEEVDAPAVASAPLQQQQQHQLLLLPRALAPTLLRRLGST